MITIAMKEDFCSFLMKKRLIKLCSFSENATVGKIDERCLVRAVLCTYVGMLKSTTKVLIIFPIGTYHDFDV